MAWPPHLRLPLRPPSRAGRGEELLRDAGAGALHHPTGAEVRVEGVHKAFGDEQVLRGVDLHLRPGLTYVLLGRSGAGKSVLLKLIAGLLHPDRGRVLVDGEDLARLSPAGMQRVWRKMGVLFQAGALFDSLTAYENLALPLRERTRLGEEEISRRVRGLLAQVRLADVEGLRPDALSGGMCKRLAFARALVLEPRLLLDDDPTAGLDPVVSAQVEGVLRAPLRRGITSLIVTCDLPLAFHLADRLGFLDEGRLLQEGPPEDFRHPMHPAVRAFLHDWLERERLGAAGRGAAGQRGGAGC